jgi:amino acid adenylation domain-containing protein/non-ribosomal peptide synthase protein (TIGR01720 family)
MGSRNAPALVAGTLDPTRDTAGTAVHIQRCLSTETTSALLTTVPVAFHARINDVLLTALVLATAAWREYSSGFALRVDIEGHGREPFDSSVDLTRSVGWFTSLYPVHLDAGNIDIDDAFAAGPAAGRALKQIKEQLQSVPANGIGYGMLRYLDTDSSAELDRYPAPQIAFNYLGRLPISDDADWQPATESAALAGFGNSALPLDHPIALNAITYDTVAGPVLFATWSFAPALLTKNEVNRLADFWNAALEALVLHGTRPGGGGLSSSDLELVVLDQSEIESFEQQYPDLEDVWPLTPLQEGLLFHAHYDSEGEDPYLVQLVFELDGAIYSARLRRALDALLDRHASLRVAFHQNRQGQPLQIVLDRCAMPWQYHDLSAFEPGERLRRADAIENDDRRTRFVLSEAPLIRAILVRLTAERHRLLLTQHHLLGDGWSGSVLLQDILALYRHHGDGAALPQQPAFKDYLAWLHRQDKQAARDAWRSYLAGIEVPTRIAPSLAHDARVVQAQYEKQLSPEFTARLEALARQHGLTLATILQGAWTVLLSRLTNQSDVIYGIVSSGRQALVPGIERMLGLLITTTPVRARLDPAEGALALFERLQRDQASLLPHQHLPLAEIHKLAGRDVLFDTLFTYENYPVEGAGPVASEDDLPIREIRGHNSNHYPLSLAAIPGPQLGLRLHYSADLFDQASAKTLAERLVRLLEQIAVDPSVPLHRLEILAPEERRRLIHEFNDTAAPIPEATLVELFERQANRKPDNIALLFEDREVSYAELNARANQLAWSLIADGIGPEDIVALRLERSVEMMIAILGTLKAGAAYLPLDPDYPAERLAFMIEDAKPKRVLTNTFPDLTRFPSSSPTDTDRTTPLRPDHPAYLIYTSGSTGTPKGVTNTHRNVVRLFDDSRPWFRFDENDTSTLFHSYAFDFSVSEMWGALLHGGRLVIVPKHVALSAQAFRELLARHSVTVVNQTTLAFQNLINSDGAASHHFVPRTVIFGGEACPRDLTTGWTNRCSVLHAYGPTETTVFATMTAPLSHEVVPPIGAPIANTRIYVLDTGLRLCPVGVVGELYISGIGLARGYWNRPGMTAERFVANPFAIEPGERLYRTGDLAFWREDGNLVFHGRADEQVKIRGFRIEPGEIEATLMNEPEIQQAVVIAREDTAGNKRLIAYLVRRNDFDLHELRQRLATRLPEFMVPAAFVVLDKLPLTPNRKLDRKALPSPEGWGLATRYVAPTTPEETLLCDLVAELLGIERAGLADNFFHLGGHSLIATRLALQVRARLGRELPVLTIFEHPVLGALAKQIGFVTNSATAFNVLLPIRTNGSLSPLFCLHPGTGLCWPYTNLLHVTSNDQPIYGIQARGFAADDRLSESLNDIVIESIEKIRAIEPCGPYRLLGWSFGGIIAHMIATRLQAEGYEVERLQLFDSYPPQGDAEEEPHTMDSIWREIALGTSLAIPPQSLSTKLNAETIFSLAQKQSHILGTFSLHQLEQLAAVLANNSRLVTTATLDTFNGDITLFAATRATADLDRSKITANAWRLFCRGNVRTVHVDAEHHQMLSMAALQQIGDSLRR